MRQYLANFTGLAGIVNITVYKTESIFAGCPNFWHCCYSCYSSWHTWCHHQMETFPRNWPFVRVIHRSPMKSPHKGQWRGALVFFICTWMNGGVKNGVAADLRRICIHYDVNVMDADFFGWPKKWLSKQKSRRSFEKLIVTLLWL